MASWRSPKNPPFVALDSIISPHMLVISLISLTPRHHGAVCVLASHLESREGSVLAA